MTRVAIKQMLSFKKAYKKLPIAHKQHVDDAIRSIMVNPKIGQGKKGDLAGVFVYKFKIRHQEILLAYEWSSHERLLLALGTHENFYRNLKRDA